MTHGIISSWQAGGWGMYPTLLFGLFALYFAARRAPSHRVLGTSIATLFAGFLGTITGFMRTLQYAADHPIEEMMKFVCLGSMESLSNLALSLVMLVLVVLTVSVVGLPGRPD